MTDFLRPPFLKPLIELSRAPRPAADGGGGAGAPGGGGGGTPPGGGGGGGAIPIGGAAGGAVINRRKHSSISQLQKNISPILQVQTDLGDQHSTK